MPLDQTRDLLILRAGRRLTEVGPRARGRLDRLLIIAGQPSILAAAQALGIWQATLYEQVARLERA